MVTGSVETGVLESKSKLGELTSFIPLSFASHAITIGTGKLSSDWLFSSMDNSLHYHTHDNILYLCIYLINSNTKF